MLGLLALVATTTVSLCAPPSHAAVLVRAIDGDTADIAITLDFGVTVERRVRLIGIDTPELHSTNPAERARALTAQARLTSLLRRPFCARGLDLDKYGRTLAVLFRPKAKKSINQTMVDEGLARPYGGGKRAPW